MFAIVAPWLRDKAWMAKLQHWRGFRSLFGLKSAPVLEFV